MKFITLTKADGKKQLLNLSQITHFQEFNSPDDDSSNAFFLCGNNGAYQEDLSEIAQLIKLA